MAILDSRVSRAQDGAAAFQGPVVIALASRPAHGGRIATGGFAVRLLLPRGMPLASACLYSRARRVASRPRLVATGGRQLPVPVGSPRPDGTCGSIKVISVGIVDQP